MRERRFNNRLLCAELVELEFRDAGGRSRRRVVNLEDISKFGVCLQSDVKVPDETKVNISYGEGRLVGVVRYCVFRDTSYFLGIELLEGGHWFQERFKPKHLLDPRQLVHRVLDRRDGAPPVM